jgi:hypothetical protein
MFLRHPYDHVAPDVLWKLAQDDLAAIEKVCREELVAAEEQEPWYQAHCH